MKIFPFYRILFDKNPLFSAGFNKCSTFFQKKLSKNRAKCDRNPKKSKISRFFTSILWNTLPSPKQPILKLADAESNISFENVLFVLVNSFFICQGIPYFFFFLSFHSLCFFGYFFL